MRDYILRLSDCSDGLAHSGTKGMKWGRITKNVGKYYIPKGEKGHAKAEKRYEKERSRLDKNRERNEDRYRREMRDLNDAYTSGKINEDQFRRMGRNTTRKFNDARKAMDRTEDSLDDMKERLDKSQKKIDRDRKVSNISDLSDDELTDLMARTNKEKVTLNNLKQIREHENGGNKGESDQTYKDRKNIADNLVGSAKDLDRTLSSLRNEYKKNPPTKKPKQTDLSELSDSDIQKMINRARLEQQYREIADSSSVDNGKVRAAAALSAIGTALVVGTQVVNFATSVKELKK